MQGNKTERPIRGHFRDIAGSVIREIMTGLRELSSSAGAENRVLMQIRILEAKEVRRNQKSDGKSHVESLFALGDVNCPLLYTIPHPLRYQVTNWWGR